MFRKLVPLITRSLRVESFGAVIVLVPLAVVGTLSTTTERSAVLDASSTLAWRTPLPTMTAVRPVPVPELVDQPQPAGDGSAPSDPALPVSTGDPAGPFPPPSSNTVMDQVDQYLWAVYERSPIKRDSTGDFTWKDVLAALRMGMSLKDYVIGGMDPDFRELLYHAGTAMDAAGIHWTILSAFRDDYRQGLAAGYKAHAGNSLHGGSVATGGYGHGCAVDIVDKDGHSENLWQWIDLNSAKVGLHRPLPRIDPAHIQPAGAWHEFAAALRDNRSRIGTGDSALPDAQLATSAGSPGGVLNERDAACVDPHHREEAAAAVSSVQSRAWLNAWRRLDRDVKVSAAEESAHPERKLRDGFHLAAREASRHDWLAARTAEPDPVKTAKLRTRMGSGTVHERAHEARHALHGTPRNTRQT